MSHYSKRRITIFGCILLCLGFALLLLPVDQTSYARNSARNIRGAFKAGKGKPEPAPPKRGMVRLREITPVPAKENGSGAMNQVVILKGEVPHLTRFERSVFAPGDEVEAHSYATEDEVYYGEQGKGTIEISALDYSRDENTAIVIPVTVGREEGQVTPGTCVHVAAGQKHSLQNHGDEDWAIVFFGVDTEPEGAGVGKGYGVISANAFHAVNP